MDTDTFNIAEKHRLPDLHEPWRRPQDQYIRAQLTLDYYELNYATLALYPRDQVAHRFVATGAWNRKGLLEKLGPYILRTEQRYVKEETETDYSLISIVARLPEGPIIIFDDDDLEVFAPSMELAGRVGDQLCQEFYRPPVVEFIPHFFIMRITSNGIASTYVKLSDYEALDDKTMELYYGNDILAWRDHLLQGIAERHSGISILQGPPGTGKTSFLRNLLVSHGENLRCFFIPSSNFNVLKDPEFVGYWATQRANFPDMKLVVILEDAEAILATRSGDNRAEISNLLNITDGLMGDFLRLHLICTMNGDFEDLDPAILRPGRLVARRHFGRIPRARALELVQYLEKPAPAKVQEDYSLAELFDTAHPEDEIGIPPKRVLGFTPAA